MLKSLKLGIRNSVKFDDILKFKDGYIIYMQVNGKIYGQINKISTSYILPEPKAYFLTRSFKKIVKEEGVKLIKEPDILFYPSSQEGKEIDFIIFNKKNFELLFDYSEYKRENALEFLENIKDLFTFDIMDEKILESLLDKNMINMLNKPIIKDHKQYNYDTKYLQNVKREYPELKFEIDLENDKVILPADPKNKKQGFTELLKAISYHYALTFDHKVLEVNPIRLVRKPR